MRAEQPNSLDESTTEQVAMAACTMYTPHPTTDLPPTYTWKEGGQGGRGPRLRGVDGTKPFVLPGLLPLCT